MAQTYGKACYQQLRLPAEFHIHCALMKATVLTAVLLAIVASASTQQSEFRWVARTSDAAVFGQIEAAFSSELKPDASDSQSHTVPMTVKFIERVGLRGDSCLVVIGEKESTSDPYTVFRAFSFDLRTRNKSPVRRKGVEWFWMWRVEKVAHLTPTGDTDIIFQYLSCTECESARLLASFHYVPTTGWEVREWSKEDGAALLIGSDLQYGDEGWYWYDCLHTVSDINGDGLDDVAVRCREQLQPDPEKPFKRVIKDTTLLYTARGGQFTRTAIDKTSDYAASVEKSLCATKPNSPLCLKPRSGKRP
jgi:hypothetical protein